MTLTNQVEILEQIKTERDRQDKKFGRQPRFLTPSVYIAVLGEEFGEVCKAAIEGDSQNYRIELVQLAAVAVAAIEDYDRGEAAKNLDEICKPIIYQDVSADPSGFKIPPDADWVFVYGDGENACGCPGELDWLLKKHVINYLDIEDDDLPRDDRTLEDIKVECLKNGKASSKDGYWSLYLEGGFEPLE